MLKFIISLLCEYAVSDDEPISQNFLYESSLGKYFVHERGISYSSFLHSLM